MSKTIVTLQYAGAIAVVLVGISYCYLPPTGDDMPHLPEAIYSVQSPSAASTFISGASGWTFRL